MKRAILFIISFLILIAIPFNPDCYIHAQSTPLRKELSNGLIAILSEDHSMPLASVHICVNTGSTTEGTFEGAGISHFLEHMIFKGTDSLSPGSIGKKIKEMGGETNAYTSFDYTVYHITAPSTHIEEMINILSEQLMNAALDPEEFKKEREVILKEINMGLDDPDKYFARLIFSTAFVRHPYRHPVIGYEELFKKISRDELLQYYRKSYVPNNMVLVAGGDFDQYRVMEMVEKSFGKYPRGYAIPVYRPLEPVQTGPREKEEEFQVELTRLAMGFHGPDIASEDLYAMDILSVALGQGESSILYRKLREDKELVYSIEAWSYTPCDPGIFGITAILEEEHIEEVRKEIWQEIDSIIDKGISNKDLKKAITRLISEHIFSQETIEGKVRQLVFDEVVTHNINFSNHYIARIRKVKKDDIKKVARKYLTRDNLTLVTLVPQKEKELVSPVPKSQPPSIKKVDIPNGIKLLIREDHSVETISIRALFIGGVRYEEEETNGITDLMVEVMLKGTKSKKARDIAELIESHGGDISGYAGYNSFGFNINLLSKDTRMGIELLADIIQNPTFPEAEMNKEKKTLLADIRAIDEDIFSIAHRFFRYNFFKGHPYRFLTIGTEESVSNMTRGDLINFYKKVVTPNNLVITLFGDVDEEEAIRIIKNGFAKMQEKVKFSKGSQNANSPQEVIEKTKYVDKKQTVIMLGFKGIDNYNPDKYVFDVLDSILNNLGGRLYINLRDKKGLAYSLGAFDILGFDPGCFVFYIVTTKDKEEQSIKGLLEEIRALRKKNVSREELNRAKKELIGNHLMGLQTNSAISFKSGLDELYGLGYNNYLDYEDTISKVTQEDVLRVARKYFDLGKYLLIKVGP